MKKNQHDSLRVSKSPAPKATGFGLRKAVDQSMSLVTEPAPKLKVPSRAAGLAAAAKQAAKGPPAPICQRLHSEQMIRQAGTHSLRFAFTGSDDVADFTGLVDAPYKIRDDTGATLEQGKVGKDGRLPRQDFPKGKELTLQVGEDAWKSVTAEPSSAPAAGAMEDDANALHVDDDPYFDAALDDDSVHLDADILAYLIQHPEGEA